MEKREGLPVSPFMDRDKVNKNSSQVNFIRFVLLPLFDSLADLYPTIQVCLAISLSDNMIVSGEKFAKVLSSLDISSSVADFRSDVPWSES